MALRSMTGYGQGDSSAHGIRVVAEISSVNRRQLDVQINLPRSLSRLEPRAIEEMQKVLSRGRVTAEIRVDYQAKVKARSMKINEDLGRAYLEQLRASAQRLNMSDDFTGSMLLNLPDVVQFTQMEEDVDRIWPILQRALRQALDGLVQMRVGEGSALQADLEKRVELMTKLVGRIELRAPKVVTRHRKALHDRISKAGVDVDMRDERLLREVALFADKCDITEETTRLQSHLQQAGRLMRARSTNGKSLDFLAQEMFREINTIGAKGNDSIIVRYVVTFKSELERFREQVQNIE